MKKFGIVSVIALTSIVWLMVGCARKPATLTPAAAPMPTSAPASTPAASAPPEDSAWAKVVAAAKKEGSVTVYSGTQVGDIGQTVSRAFTDRYGIKYEIVNVGFGSTAAEKLRTEMRSGNIVGDVFDTNTLFAGTIKEAGGIATSAGLPVLQEKGVWRIEPWVSDGDRDILWHTVNYYTAFANTNVVKPGEEPKSFKELTQSKWKGKLVMLDAVASGSASTGFLPLLHQNFIDIDTLRALGKNGVTFTPTSAETARLLVQGSSYIDMMTGQGTYGSVLTGGAMTSLPVKALAMEEGTTVGNRAMSLIKNSPHPNAARVVVNWLLTKEGQSVLAKAENMTPVRSDIPDFAPPYVQVKPVRAVIATMAEEKENTRLFRERWINNLWKQ